MNRTAFAGQSSAMLLGAPMLLLLSACVETGLSGKDDVPLSDDSADDTADDSADSADSGSDPADTSACADRDFPAAAVPMLATCPDRPPATFDPVVLWQNLTVGDVLASPAVGHLTDDDGDGVAGSAGDIPDVVVIDVTGWISALSGADGSVLWTAFADTGVDPTSPALGDLDGDGWADVVVAGLYGSFAYTHDGSTLWTGAANAPMCGAAALTDLDADGLPEVILGRSILSGRDGSLRGTGTAGLGTGILTGTVMSALSTAADLDGDGAAEAVVGNAAYAVDGSSVWANGEADGFVAIADFDGDPEGEVVVSSAGTLRLQDADGTVLWTLDLQDDRSGPPTVADFDGDGDPEIGVGSRTWYGVVEADGTSGWRSTIDDSSSGTPVGAAFDFDGDGASEVVVADQQDVWIFDGRDGAVRYDEPAHSSPTCNESAVVADVDADGVADVIWGSYAVSSFGPETGITVLTSATGSWMPTRGAWNQHAYSVTNVDDDGTIPAVATPSWRADNLFRANPAGTPGDAADLLAYVLDVCEDDCAAGAALAWVAVANQGLTDVPGPVEAIVWGVGASGPVELARVTFPDGVAAGAITEGVEVALSGWPEPLTDLQVEVPGGVVECDTTNNVGSWGAAVCP